MTEGTGAAIIGVKLNPGRMREEDAFFPLLAERRGGPMVEGCQERIRQAASHCGRTQCGFGARREERHGSPVIGSKEVRSLGGAGNLGGTTDFSVP